MTESALVRSDGRHSGGKYSIGVLALLYAAFAAASSAPTPLYAIYQQQWGFAAFTLTIVFAAYVVALLVSLLCFGSFSDVVGRKPPIVWAIAIEIVALVVFLSADDVSWLIAGRAVQGLATGIAFTSVSAAIVDNDPRTGSLINSLIPLVALAAGVLSSAAIVEVFADTRAVWMFLIGLFIFLALLTRGVQETVLRNSEKHVSLIPAIRVPRLSLIAVLPLCVASWALAAFYFSLGPSVVKLVTSSDSAVIGGVTVAALTLPGAVAVAMSRNTGMRASEIGASTALILGVSVTGASLEYSFLTGLVLGTAISGAGFGAGFLTGFRRLFSGIRAEERGGMMAAYYAICYAAFSLPAVAAGYGVGVLGLSATTFIYGAALIVIAVVALVVSIWRA